MGAERYHVLTTCNAAGWEQTGRRMVESVIEKWPAEALPLTIYAEDFTPDVDGITVRPLPEWLAAFKARHAENAAAHGRRGAGYEYRFDAVKFAHKVAAFTDFGQGLTDGVMIWIDADTFTHAPVTTDWLEGLFPPPYYVAWLDRLHSHIEAGFLMFRCDHPYHHAMMESLRNVYVSDEVFRLRETHDSYVIQQLVEAKARAGKIPPPLSLSAGARRFSHAFVNSRLGECLDHMKGARKLHGRSAQRDLLMPRKEPYWNGRAV